MLQEASCPRRASKPSSIRRLAPLRHGRAPTSPPRWRGSPRRAFSRNSARRGWQEHAPGIHPRRQPPGDHRRSAHGVDDVAASMVEASSDPASASRAAAPSGGLMRFPAQHPICRPPARPLCAPPSLIAGLHRNACSTLIAVGLVPPSLRRRPQRGSLPPGPRHSPTHAAMRLRSQSRPERTLPVPASSETRPRAR